MNIRPIRNDGDLRAAFQRLEQGAVDPADPVEATKFRLKQQGLTPKDLERYIGSSGRVSESLNRKRGLSLQKIKHLHDGLHIPYESLFGPSIGCKAIPINPQRIQTRQ
jgi:HTH-type transcriptional regulator/antitoxin HigA